MTVADREGSGPLTTVLAEDHRRLDALLHSATSAADHIDQAVYDQFRAGLLRHIGMEEKLLLPGGAALAGGTPADCRETSARSIARWRPCSCLP